jgi:hypothetical protein
MQQTTIIFAIVCVLLVTPLVCDAGIAEHDCVCDAAECCTDDLSCERDPCDVVYEPNVQRDREPSAVAVSAQFVTGVILSPPYAGVATAPPWRDSSNIPFPFSDLPLRV